jgi:hypothetical protein
MRRKGRKGRNEETKKRTRGDEEKRSREAEKKRQF